MVTLDDQVKIMDFCLAKSHGRVQLTQTGTTLGTVAYMSPEQARGEEVDGRTDIWSLGAVLYEMITGQKPFKGGYEPAVVYSILNSPQEPVTALRSGVPMELERVVNKALEKDPALRYQSAADLCADLKRLRRDSSTDRVAVTPPPAAAGPKRRWPWVAAVVAVAALAAGLSTLLPDKPPAPSRAMTIKPLTSFAGLECFPSWSPDGRTLVFSRRGPAGEVALWKVDLETRRQLQMTHPQPRCYDVEASWSPDGKQIAFARVGTKEKGLWLLPAAGGVTFPLDFTPVEELVSGPGRGQRWLGSDSPLSRS